MEHPVEDGGEQDSSGTNKDEAGDQCINGCEDLCCVGLKRLHRPHAAKWQPNESVPNIMISP